MGGGDHRGEKHNITNGLINIIHHIIIIVFFIFYNHFYYLRIIFTSAGMPGLSSPFSFSTLTFKAKTSLTRSSRV